MSMAKGSRSAAQVTQYQGWDSVRIAVDEVIASVHGPFDPNTITNVRDLLAVCCHKSPLPFGVGKGYWNSVILWWSKFEIEVFEDRLEVYRFYSQRTDIWYEEHTPGETFTPRFLAELASL